jgi:DNA transformation protein
MANDPSFVAHAVDLLSLVGPVTARAMFGGHGLYAEGVMFALLDDGELFVKTDAETRATFVDAGCRPWVVTSRGGRMENTGYFRPPDEAHEDPEAMLPWALLGLEAAARAAARKAKPAARARPARTPGGARKARRRGKAGLPRGGPARRAT